MPLVKWTPFLEPFEEMENLFKNFHPLMKGFSPSIDVYEEKENVIVETSLAGVDPEKVEVSVKNDVLTIKGESAKKSEVEEKNYYRKEIRSGSFFRSVALPAHVEGEKARASATKGILKVVIPKAVEKKPKTVKVEVKDEGVKKPKVKKSKKK